MELCLNNNDSRLVMAMETAVQSEFRMPFDDEVLDFFQTEDDDEYEDKTNPYTPQIISPYQNFAFTEEVLHEVANQTLGFYLPDEMWSFIERAFAYYWDVEVGLNGVTCEDYMFLSIRQKLIDRNVFLPDELLAKVVSGMYDFILEIPGAILDY